jgi:hypothetical protein
MAARPRHADLSLGAVLPRRLHTQLTIVRPPKATILHISRTGMTLYMPSPLQKMLRPPTTTRSMPRLHLSSWARPQTTAPSERTQTQTSPLKLAARPTTVSRICQSA